MMSSSEDASVNVLARFPLCNLSKSPPWSFESLPMEIQRELSKQDFQEFECKFRKARKEYERATTVTMFLLWLFLALVFFFFLETFWFLVPFLYIVSVLLSIKFSLRMRSRYDASIQRIIATENEKHYEYFYISEDAEGQRRQLAEQSHRCGPESRYCHYLVFCKKIGSKESADTETNDDF